MTLKKLSPGIVSTCLRKVSLPGVAMLFMFYSIHLKQIDTTLQIYNFSRNWQIKIELDMIYLILFLQIPAPLFPPSLFLMSLSI